MRFYDDLGHCPKCGKWCGKIMGTITKEWGLKKVEGNCKRHGLVDLSHQSWSVDDFVEHGEIQ